MRRGLESWGAGCGKKSERGARAFLRPLTLSAHALKHAHAAALQRERGVSRRGWCCDCCFASWCCCCSSPRGTLRQEKMKITCHLTTPIPFSLQPLFFRPLHQKKKTMASLCTMRSASAARLTSKVRGSRWRPTAAGVVGDTVIPHPSRAGRGARREGGSCHGTPPPLCWGRDKKLRAEGRVGVTRAPPSLPAFPRFFNLRPRARRATSMSATRWVCGLARLRRLCAVAHAIPRGPAFFFLLFFVGRGRWFSPTAAFFAHAPLPLLDRSLPAAVPVR